MSELWTDHYNGDDCEPDDPASRITTSAGQALFVHLSVVAWFDTETEYVDMIRAIEDEARDGAISPPRSVPPEAESGPLRVPGRGPERPF
jgi:hypothetical protein